METVEDMDSEGTFLTDDLQIGFPHIGADEYDFGGQFVADDGEEALEGFDGAFPAHPEQARDANIDLINERQILVSFGVLDLVDPDGIDLAEHSMLQPESDDVFYSVKNLFPLSAEGRG